MTLLLMMSLLFAGMLGLQKLALSDMPNVDYPTIYVTADLPGANPETVAREVSSVLEKEFASLKKLEHMSSFSWLGGCYVLLQFSLDKDIDLAAHEVQRAIDKAYLPNDLLERPKLHRRSVNHSTVLYAVFSSSALEPEKLYHFASDHLQKPLSLIEGVSEVRLSGASESIEIEIDPIKLAARGISLEEVKRSLQREGASIPVGRLEERRLGLHVPQRLQTAEDLGKIAIAYRERTPVLLKDLGSIQEKGMNIDHFRFIGGERNETGLLIEIKKEPGVNVVSLCDKVKRELLNIQKNLPPTHHINIILDQSVWIQEALHDLEWNLVLSLILVSTVIFFFLGRLQDTLIPCLALPLSLLGTCAAMYVLDYSLDILSLLALTLAMGFVVDDAIVVLENIARLREEGKTPWEAALIGSKQIGFTVLSMTVSLIAVFIPLLFMGGILGKLFREFSLSLSIAIFLSGLVSLTLTPMLCAKLSPTAKLHKKVPSIPSYFRWYETSLSWCLRHKKTTLFTGIFSLICSLWVFQTLPVEMLPKEDLGWGTLSIRLPAGLSEEEIKEYQTQVEKSVSNHPSVDCLASWVDKTSLFMFVKLIEKTSRPAVKTVLDELEEHLEKTPGLSAWSYTRGLISFSLGDGNEGEFTYTLRSHDLKELQSTAELLEKKMKTHPLFEQVRSDLPTPSPQLSIHIAKEKADLLGLSFDGVQRALQNAYTESTPLILEKSGARVPVYLKLPIKDRENAESLEKLFLKSSYGAMVPLKAVASWKEETSAPHIQHIFQLPAANISFKLAEKATLEEATDALSALSQDLLSPSTRGEIAGEGSAQKKLLTDMFILLLLALLAMYVVLGILYESFIHPLTILSSLPFAGLGAGLSLLLCQTPLSLYSFVGLILLIGIVKKNGIMLVDHALQSEKPAEEAIYEAGLIRFRPIMMTTLAALMGALPVALGFGAGGETRRGLGIAICGGLLFSQMLTLYLTPVVYLYLDKMRRKNKTDYPS